MASANLELARMIYAAGERGNFSEDKWAHPGIEFVRADTPEAGRWRGLSGMATAFQEFLSAWQDVRIEATQYRELDDERVLVLVSFSGRGKTSGMAGADHAEGDVFLAAALDRARRANPDRVRVYVERDHHLGVVRCASPAVLAVGGVEVGEIKANRGVRRFQRRGRLAVLSEWRLLTATHNLLKLHQHRLAAA